MLIQSALAIHFSFFTFHFSLPYSSAFALSEEPRVFSAASLSIEGGGGTDEALSWPRPICRL
jgi:hypothetical protein